MSSGFTGIWVPLVTPFTPDGHAVDHHALRQLVARLREAGVSGFVALGTTGEPAALDLQEQDAVLATVLDAASSTPVVAGLSGNHRPTLHARARHLGTLPLAGLLVPAPYYVRPGQDGIRRHFLELADVSIHPLIVYDIPYRTGVPIHADTLLSLAEHPHIRAVKDCGGDLEKTLAVLADGRLQVLAGEDLQLFNALCLGASGAIVASAHLHTPRFVALYRALCEDRLSLARDLFASLAPCIRALFSEPNPGPVKAALAEQGMMSDTVRPPLGAAGTAFLTRWRQVCDN